MAKPTAEQIAKHEASVFFRQLIDYDRSKGFCGYMYEGKKPVRRAIMVIKSDQASSVMVQRGFPYIAFITCGDKFYDQVNVVNESKFFATAEEAVAFCKDRLSQYKLVGAADGRLA